MGVVVDDHCMACAAAPAVDVADYAYGVVAGQIADAHIPTEIGGAGRVGDGVLIYPTG